jgi:RNA polymerase sigma factor (sigma-70 family)
VTAAPSLESLLRTLAPQVLGALVRRYGHFEAAEDAVQEALLAAALQWPIDGVPDSAAGWLIRVASRRLIDELRSELARARREVTEAQLALAQEAVSEDQLSRDDTLVLLLLCCHPALSSTSQVALTLRAVGGLTTAEVARAFLVPEATMAQRIARAKNTIRDAGARFELPPATEMAERLRAVSHVLYLIFNEGYTTTSGATLHRVELSDEAIRITRLLRTLLPADGEVAGLLALMLLIDSRRDARIGDDGGLLPIAEQDRSLWDGASIAEGVALVTWALANTPLGPYQVQAAIAAVHAESGSATETDWPQIVALYEVLEGLAPGPMVTLSRSVAVAMVDGPSAGLGMLEPLAADPRLAGHHRFHAVRAHLQELAGDTDAAREEYLVAAGLTQSTPERQYLSARAARLPPRP